MTWILVGGAISGAGVLFLVLNLAQPVTQPAAALAELDTRRSEGGSARTRAGSTPPSPRYPRGRTSSASGSPPWPGARGSTSPS